MNSLMVIEKYKGNEEVFMKDIVQSKGANLPSKIDDVLAIFEFTDFKAKAFKMLSDKMKKLEEQGEVYQTALRSGQQWGIAALYAQKKLGEISKKIPRAEPITIIGYRGAKPSASQSKSKILGDAGINRNIYQDAQRMASNPDIIDRVIDNAKKRGEIPTKTAVLNTIRIEANKERGKVIKKKSDDKLDNQRVQAVADYYEAIKGYEAALDFAIIAAERGKFAPEGKNFLVKKHNKIREKMNKLEEKVNG